MILDATDTIVGRLATKAAQAALRGETVAVINVEKAIISGPRKLVAEQWREKRRMGQPTQGPFIPTQPTRFVRRIIRGMLPHKNTRGREALARVKCYTGIPAHLEGQKAELIAEANVSKIPTSKYMSIGTLCRQMRERK